MGGMDFAQMMNPQIVSQMLQNPMVQQMMQQLASNPQLMQQVFDLLNQRC